MTDTDERAEFAELQRDEGSFEGSEAERDAREMRRRALWQRHGEAWMQQDLGFAPGASSSMSAVYRDGSPHTVELPLPEALERAPKLAALPLHTLRLTALDPRLLALAEAGALRGLRGLELGYGLEKLSQDELTRLLRSGHLDQLEELTLSPHRDVPEVWGALGSFPRLGALKKLSLWQIVVTPERARWLGRALISLESLACRVSLTGASLEALAGAAVFSLRELSLMDSDGRCGRTALLGDLPIARVLGAPMVERLTHLSLFGCHLGEHTASALSGLPCAGRLESLDLGSQGAPDVARALGGCDLPALRHLSIRHNALFDFDLEVLSRFAGLEALRVEKNGLGARGVATILQRLPRLRELNLADTSTGDEGALALAERAPASLRRLDVSNAGLTARGASALASSPRLAQLRELTVAANAIGKPGVRALADSDLDKMACLSVEYTMKGDPAPLFEEAWLRCREPLAGHATYERRLEPSGAPVPRSPRPRAPEPRARPQKPLRELDEHATYRVGEHVRHPEHGPGEITSVTALFIEAKYASVGKVKSPLIPAGAAPYDMSRHYQPGELLLHPRFGAGLVLTTSPDRMEVDFGVGGKRTLLHARG